MTYGDPNPGEGNPVQQSQWPTMPAQAQSVPPQAGSFGPPQQVGPSQPFQRTPEPDWGALADKHERDSKRGKWKLIGAVSAAFVLGAVAGGVGVKAMGGSTPGSPVAGPSGSGGTSASASGAPGGGQLADADGSLPLVAGGSAQIKPGNGSKVLSLNGTDDSYAAASGPAVNTDQSFTVSAWVLLGRAEGAAMAVSQGEGGSYTFALGRDYWPGHHGWVFKIQTAAGSSDNTTYPAYSTGDAPLNTWVYLTGTYDVANHTMALYVDGKLAQQLKVPGIWHNGGGLQVGRIRYKDAWGNGWDGAIAHIQIWNKALTPDQVLAAVHDKSGVSTVHSWLVN